MRERLLFLAFIAVPMLMASPPEARAESAMAKEVASLSSYGAAVGSTFKAMLASLDAQIEAFNTQISTSASPPIAAVKFSTINTDGNPVPCELTLAKMRAVLASVAPSSAHKARFEDLKSRGIERCRANDDAQANAYLSEALGMLGR